MRPSMHSARWLGSAFEKKAHTAVISCVSSSWHSEAGKPAGNCSRALLPELSRA